MISYSQANIADIQTIIDMENRCFNKFDCFSPKNLKRMLRNPNNSVIIELIQFEYTVVGYAVFLTRINSNKIRLYSMCISPDYSGKGYGKIYLSKRINDFAEQFSAVTLEVRITNKRAISLYENSGFIINKIIPNYYSDGESAYRMLKNIV